MNLRRTALIVVVATLFAGTSFWLGRVSAETGEPGSAADPLVSKSYVESVSRFQVVNVPAGARIEAEGGTEIVLRAGQARAIASVQGGILDATGGTDLAQGAAVTKNHLLVVPRTDGRGLQAVSDLVLMVRGAYQIKTGL
jgi:hypothetical protein